MVQFDRIKVLVGNGHLLDEEKTRSSFEIVSKCFCESTWRNVGHRHCRAFLLHLGLSSIRGFPLDCNYGIVQAVLLSAWC